MNVEIGAEAALFPEKEYINGIAVAVLSESNRKTHIVGIHNYCSSKIRIGFNLNKSKKILIIFTVENMSREFITLQKTSKKRD
jgi:hypothetical protein